MRATYNYLLIINRHAFYATRILVDHRSLLLRQVCQLRERRLDLEEELTEEKKTSDTLKKEYDALVKKSKVIDSALKTAEADLEAFQVRGGLFVVVGGIFFKTFPIENGARIDKFSYITLFNEDHCLRRFQL